MYNGHGFLITCNNMLGITEVMLCSTIHSTKKHVDELFTQHSFLEPAHMGSLLHCVTPGPSKVNFKQHLEGVTS